MIHKILLVIIVTIIASIIPITIVIIKMRITATMFMIILKVLDSRLDVQPSDTLHWGVGGEVALMTDMMMIRMMIMTMMMRMMKI